MNRRAFLLSAVVSIPVIAADATGLRQRRARARIYAAMADAKIPEYQRDATFDALRQAAREGHRGRAIFDRANEIIRDEHRGGEIGSWLEALATLAKIAFYVCALILLFL